MRGLKNNLNKYRLMKTPYLDTEIELLEGFKDNKEASFYQLRKLAEYREIKQLLIQRVVLQSEQLNIEDYNKPLTGKNGTDISKSIGDELNI